MSEKLPTGALGPWSMKKLGKSRTEIVGSTVAGAPEAAAKKPQQNGDAPAASAENASEASRGEPLNADGDPAVDGEAVSEWKDAKQDKPDESFDRRTKIGKFRARLEPMSPAERSQYWVRLQKEGGLTELEIERFRVVYREVQGAMEESQ